MGSFDVITYYLLKKFKPKLSRLIIDVDKDWMGHVIKNLGTPIDPYDALRLAELNIHKSTIPLDHPDGSVTTDKIADGAITDAKVSSISRNKITDFWNTPFWDNIPDKPLTFPPEPHTHLRNEISDFWNTPFWTQIPDKPPLWEVLYDVTLEENMDYVEFQNLDIKSHGAYIMFSTVKNPLASYNGYRLYVEGYNNDTYYYHQYITVSGTSQVINRKNESFLTSTRVGESCSVIAFIILDPNGKFRAIILTQRNENEYLEEVFSSIISTMTLTNITKIRVQSRATGGLGAGSRFILTKVKSS